MIWDAVNALFALGIALCSAYLLIRHVDALHVTQRLGLGLLAGNVLMTIPPLLVDGPTPFDDWSPAVLRIGVFLYFIDTAVRIFRHQRANSALPGLLRRGRDAGS